MNAHPGADAQPLSRRRLLAAAGAVGAAEVLGAAGTASTRPRTGGAPDAAAPLSFTEATNGAASLSPGGDRLVAEIHNVLWSVPGSWEDFDPAWSPDGKRILFVRAAVATSRPGPGRMLGPSPPPRRTDRVRSPSPSPRRCRARSSWPRRSRRTADVRPGCGPRRRRTPPASSSSTAGPCPSPGTSRPSLRGGRPPGSCWSRSTAGSRSSTRSGRRPLGRSPSAHGWQRPVRATGPSGTTSAARSGYGRSGACTCPRCPPTGGTSPSPPSTPCGSAPPRAAARPGGCCGRPPPAICSPRHGRPTGVPCCTATTVTDSWGSTGGTSPPERRAPSPPAAGCSPRCRPTGGGSLGADPGLADDRRVTEVMAPWDADLVRRSAGTAPTQAQLATLRRETDVYRRLLAAGGLVALGTDAPLVPVGLSLHLGLRALHRGGLSPAGSRTSRSWTGTRSPTSTCWCGRPEYCGAECPTPPTTSWPDPPRRPAGGPAPWTGGGNGT